MANDEQIKLIARCASVAMKAVTRWYAEGLHREGYSLEEYVRDEVKAVTDQI